MISWLSILALAASPISELRGAIPLGIIHFQFPWYYVFAIAIIGNLIPVPFILLFLDQFYKLASRVKLFRRMLDWLFERIRHRSNIIKRYERIGLVLFVAIPLPITGAWTGALAASLLGIKFKHAIISIFAGIIIAGIIVTCGTLLGWAFFSA